MAKLEFTKPRLIQRLEDPVSVSRKPVIIRKMKNRKLGFNEEELDLDVISSIMSFDYMGAFEFEYGALPSAFKLMLDRKKQNQFIAREIFIDVLPPKLLYTREKIELPEKKIQPVYIITPVKFENEVVDLIKREAIRKNGDHYLKERTHFKFSVFAEDISSQFDFFESRTKGWFDLRNSFFFFIDREMFENTRKFLDIKMKQPSAKKSLFSKHHP